jgi:hypothetical protein
MIANTLPLVVIQFFIGTTVPAVGRRKADTTLLAVKVQYSGRNNASNQLTADAVPLVTANWLPWQDCLCTPQWVTTSRN